MAKRGRPAGSKNKAKNGAGEPAQKPAGPWHNVPSDDQLQTLTRDYKSQRAVLLAAEKKTKADRMNLDKKIKADLGAKGLADIKLLIQLETPEGEAEFKEDMERQARVARWSGLQLGTQGTLFDEDRRPVDERAYDEGKRAGMAGQSMQPPHAPGSPGFDPWCKGWHVGQEILFAIKKPVLPQDDLVKGPDHQEPSGPDEFDAVANGADAGDSEEETPPPAGAAPEDQAPVLN